MTKVKGQGRQTFYKQESPGSPVLLPLKLTLAICSSPGKTTETLESHVVKLARISALFPVVCKEQRQPGLQPLSACLCPVPCSTLSSRLLCPLLPEIRSFREAASSRLWQYAKCGRLRLKAHRGKKTKMILQPKLIYLLVTQIPKAVRNWLRQGEISVFDKNMNLVVDGSLLDWPSLPTIFSISIINLGRHCKLTFNGF